MLLATESREVFTLDGHGVALQGTYHKPRNERSACDRKGDNHPKRTGLLFLTGLYTSRAADGDSAVYWAESFAGLGYPSFRVDLPGAGDSGAGVPKDLLEFINAGGFRDKVATVVKQLTANYNLAGVVIVGHCSGSTSALFGAAACKECQGLILLAPYFHVSRLSKRWLRQALIEWAASRSFGSFLTGLYLYSMSVRALLRRNALPGNANIPLIKRWKELASAGLPILVLKSVGQSSGPKPQTGEFDYLRHIVNTACGKSRIQIERVEGAQHTFANRVGRDGVRICSETWLCEQFPLQEREPAAVDIMQPILLTSEAEFANHASIFAPADAALGS